MAQFKFAKELLENYDKEFLANASEEELKEIVINFIYLGKIHTGTSLQRLGNNKNKLKGENDDRIKE
jgi:hypothetical protein